MQEKIVPLTDADFKYIKKRQRSFIVECIKRYFGLGVMFLFLFGIKFMVKDFKDADFTMFYWIFLGVFIVFTFINFYLYRKFYANTLFKNKKVITGTISEKGYSHAQEGTFQYDIDHEKKVLNFNYVHKLGVANGTTWVHLRYDKNSFDGSIPLGEYLYFILEGKKVAVDVSHFATFEIGEKIQIDKMAKSNELMRIFSLDFSDKCLEQTTHKFFITRKGIKAMG